MDALRGGSLVPHLFRYDPMTVGADGIPHNRPEVMAECDAIVNERWAQRSQTLGQLASVGDLLFDIYDAQAERDLPDFAMGYVRFRQAELRMMEGRPADAIGPAMESLYCELCGSRVSFDYYADPPQWTTKLIEPGETVFFLPRWVATAVAAAQALGLTRSRLWPAFAAANARWAGNPLCQPLDIAWAATADCFPDD